MKKLGLGIDTGGTCTDGVLYDFEKKQILAEAKSLTTRQDLTVGISEVLDKLPQELLERVDIVGLSTTLATNACVENKGGRAKLLFLGGDPKVVEKVGGQYGFTDLKDIYYEDRITNLSGQILRAPDWNKVSETIEERFGDCDGVGVIEIYAMRNGGVLEKQARELIEQKLSIPVTCGNELFSDLGSMQRGAGALLNARLIPIIRDFLEAVHISLARRNISAPMVIMRSDGSIMSEEFARTHPVETLLCGPAASVIGAATAVTDQNCVVVDMGGTTTDIALIDAGAPLYSDDGISVGRWKTYVKGLYVDTFGLGGDSAVRYADNRLYLDSARVIPLCVLSAGHPEVKQKLKQLAEGERVHYTRLLHEWYCLMKDISDNPRYSAEEKSFCQALKEHPMMIEEAAAAIGKDIYSLDISRLEKEGVVLRAGLTPTDIMHIKGDFCAYDAEASRYGAAYVARVLDVTPEALCDMVYDAVMKKMYCNIVRILLENSDSYYKKNGVGADLLRLIENSYDQKNDRFVTSLFQTSFSLVGVGAPIHVFLPDVAKRLGTRAEVPRHASVTNAVGAIAGDVSARVEIEIRPTTLEDEQDGYALYGGEEILTFLDKEEALQKAVEVGTQKVKRLLKERGGTEDKAVTVAVKEQQAEATASSIYLGTVISVRG